MRVVAEVLPVLFLYAIVTPIEVGARTTCSCYNYTTSGKGWYDNRISCQTNGHDLVSMETNEEWEFIKNAIQMKTTLASSYDEWHIGLYRKNISANWTWVSGNLLTIRRWQPGKPKNDLFNGKTERNVVVIARAFPAKHYGKFNNLRDELLRAYICESVTTVISSNCSVDCWTHPSLPTTTYVTPSSSPSLEITSSSPKGEESTTSFPEEPSRKSQTSDTSQLVLILAVVFGVLFVVVAVVLGFFLFRRFHRSRRPTTEGAEEQKPKLDERQSDPDNPYDNVNQEAAKLLGTPKKEETQTYAEISDRNDTYATVDKSKKKKRENKEELCYAELGELDVVTGRTEPEKPAPYTPTVYADVVGTVADKPLSSSKDR